MKFGYLALLIGLVIGLGVGSVIIILVKKPVCIFKYFTQRVIYLTIDDGPSTDTKNKVDYLVAHNIPAIFFCTGQRMEQYPDTVMYAIQKGFIIGNHLYSHQRASQLGFRATTEEILKTEKIINDLYEKAGVKRPIKVIRFPYCDKGNRTDFFNQPKNTAHEIVVKNTLQLFLKRHGFKQPAFENIAYKYYKQRKLDLDVDVAWTFDTRDYALRNPQRQQEMKLFSLNDLLKRMDKRNPELCLGLNSTLSNEIVLIHDFDNLTDLFQPLLEKLKSMGFVFALPEMCNTKNVAHLHSAAYLKT
jgi:peptidoglycan/xylan/chitin deacetylase (PgdA/CDA1 family)